MPILRSEKTGRAYAAIPDKHDSRDFLLKAAPMPPTRAVSLFDQLGSVKDQGQEGSCTGNAGCGHFETVIFKQTGKRLVLSPQFLYYKERELEGSLPDDAGAQSRTIFKVLNQFGCCEESEDPYDTSKMNNVPTPEQLTQAAEHKIGAYHRNPDLGSIISCLASGWTCTVAIGVYSSFETDEVAKTGVVPIPNDADLMLGGHEIYAWGYDLDGTVSWNKFGTKGVMLRNSWGASWGKDGDFLLPFEYFHNSDWFSDSWMGHIGPPWVPQPK